MIRLILLAVFCFGLGLVAAIALLMLPGCHPSRLYAIAVPETRVTEVSLHAQSWGGEWLLWQWRPADGLVVAAVFDVGATGDGTYRLKHRRQGEDEMTIEDFDYISGRLFASDLLLSIDMNSVNVRTLPRPSEPRGEYPFLGSMVRLGTTWLPCLLR
jgi:hypothetical protein